MTVNASSHPASESHRAPDADWHALTPDLAATRLEVDTAVGLSDAEAALRLTKHGANRLPEAVGRGPAAIRGL